MPEGPSHPAKQHGTDWWWCGNCALFHERSDHHAGAIIGTYGNTIEMSAPIHRKTLNEALSDLRKAIGVFLRTLVRPG